MKILIIENDEDVRSVASLSLSLIGKLEVVEAESGAEGLEKALLEKPDAILLDLALPEADADETVNALKSNPQTSPIPLVFLTTRTLSRDYKRMRELGGVGIIYKPFDPMTIASQLQEIIKK